MHYGRCASGECTVQKQARGTVKWRQKMLLSIERNVEDLDKYNISHKEITKKKQHAHPEKKNTKFSIIKD